MLETDFAATHDPALQAEPETVELPTEKIANLKQAHALDAAHADATLKGYLFRPRGAPRNRAAVVVVQGLGGVQAHREMTYGRKLAQAGYVALVVDTFGTLGVENYNDQIKALVVSSWTLVADTFAGLRYLARHPAVNTDAICCIGFSWGGMTTVMAAYEQIRRSFLESAPVAFAGHVSYYGCSIPRMEDPTTTGAPVLLLVAERDENVSLPRTREIAEDLRSGGSQAEIKVFDAHHQWDGDDYERRHVPFHLRDLTMTITRDNEMRPTPESHEIANKLTQFALIARKADSDGYDIQRDPQLHAETDAILLDFVAGRARAAGAVVGDA
jgi:dienelactone hydrolase